MYRPPFLQPGDKVALVSPAGSIEANYIHDAMEILRTWELHPVTGVHVCENKGILQEAMNNAARICNGLGQ